MEDMTVQVFLGRVCIEMSWPSWNGGGMANSGMIIHCYPRNNYQPFDIALNPEQSPHALTRQIVTSEHEREVARL